jgi:hypothetical protein
VHAHRDVPVPTAYDELHVDPVGEHGRVVVRRDEQRPGVVERRHEGDRVRVAHVDVPRDPGVTGYGDLRLAEHGRLAQVDRDQVALDGQRLHAVTGADRDRLGRVDEAFDRLIGQIKVRTGPERDEVRVRLLALFDTVGNADPRVLKARRALMTALF